ncbi:hypothetical protein ACLK1S_13185 [Escherichia coli]
MGNAEFVEGSDKLLRLTLNMAVKNAMSSPVFVLPTRIRQH